MQVKTFDITLHAVCFRLILPDKNKVILANVQIKKEVNEHPNDFSVVHADCS